MIIEIISAGVIVIAVLVAINTAYSFLCLAPWVPTPKRELERINRLACLKEGDVFYEVGCGTAAISAFVAKKNPGVRVTGIELALPLYLFARAMNIFRRLGNLEIEFGDALARNYADADVVYVYGFPESVNGRLKAKLERELKPGARFISYAFTVHDWQGSGSVKDKPTPRDANMNVYVK